MMPWGRDGDYLTAPTASTWYGVTVAGFLADLAGGASAGFRLVDLAAGDGSFVAAVLAGMGADAARVLTAAMVVDRSAAMRERAGIRLAESAVDVEITAAMHGRRDRPSVIHASELYDAMPVHRVEQTKAGLMEMVVAVDDGRLGWRRRVAGTELVRYFTRA